MKVYINRIPAGEVSKGAKRSGSEFLLRLVGINLDLSKRPDGGVEAVPQGIYSSLFSFRNEAGQVMIDMAFWRTDWFLTIILMRVRPWVFISVTHDSVLEETE